MKNPNGFGTVYKMKGKRRNKWRAVKTIAWEDNKQKRVTIGYFENKTTAMEALGKHIYNPNEKLTFGNVYEMWSKKHFEKVSPDRARDIKYRYKNHIHILEKDCISEITLQRLQSFIDKLELSSGSVSSIKAILNMVFDYAVKNDFISKNPVKFVELKKYKKVQIKKEITDIELQLLWDNLDIYYADVILILIYTGMRVSEFINLRKDDINLSKNVIYISKSKTEAGVRNIPIHNKILPLLINKMKNSKDYLLTINNRKISYSFFRKNFNFVFSTLGMYPHTPHECRHTTATLLSNAGANPISIAKIMGHSDYAMTANVYTHKDEKELKKAMLMLT